MHWASISHEYRDIDDFMPLCQSHHRRHDREFRMRTQVGPTKQALANRARAATPEGKAQLARLASLNRARWDKQKAR